MGKNKGIGLIEVTCASALLACGLGLGLHYMISAMPTPDEETARLAEWEEQLAEWNEKDAERDAERGYKLLSKESGESADTLCFETLLNAGFKSTIFGDKKISQIVSDSGQDQWLIVRSNKDGTRRRCIVDAEGEYIISHNGSE